MARTLMKHVARRQDQSFADWCAEIMELAGKRWPEFSDQAPTLYAVWGGVTPAQALYTGWAHSRAEGRVTIHGRLKADNAFRRFDESHQVVEIDA